MNVFKAKRIEMCLSITDVAYEIKYPIAIIEALERNELNFLPKPYSYYCVRSYGYYLNIINLESILAKYK